MVELEEGNAAAFFDVPFHVYDSAVPYVSPLRQDLARFLDAGANPLFREFGSRRFFVARRDGRPVGRIVAHVHRASNERFGWKRAYFGFFDCAPDLEAARLLLDEAGGYGRSLGCDELWGNFNLTAMQQVGILTAGFEHVPYSDQHYNPPHQPELLAACGFVPEFPMRTFEADLATLDPETLLGARQRERLEDPALRWEDIDLRHFLRILNGMRVALNDGFERNPMFVPLTEEEFRFQAGDLSTVMDPAISQLVYDSEGAVGTVVCIPDLNPLLRSMRSRMTWSAPLHFARFKLTRQRAVIIFYSVAKRWQNRGLNGAMLYRVVRALKARGYRRLGITWIADSNASSLKQMEKLGARTLHRLHLFRKPLAP